MDCRSLPKALTLMLALTSAHAVSQTGNPAAAERTGEKVRSLSIYVLSTAVAGAQSMNGFGEWGFSALVVAAGLIN